MYDDLVTPELVARQILDFRQMQAFAQEPFVVVEGEGLHVTDHTGQRYLDGLSGVFVNSVGHRNPAVIAAMTEQLHRLAFAPPLAGTNDAALALTRELLHFAGNGFGAVKLLSGGSEATEAAMKLARQYHQQSGHPRKHKILARYGGYHGATMGALSASGGWERKSVFEPLVAGFLHVHPPTCNACPYDHTLDECRAHNLFTCARHVERTILAEDPETIAAVIMEPMSVNGSGFTVPPAEYLPMVREVCDKYNILLIFDEIITGFGRLGTNFGGDYYGVVPDLLCVGKGMSGGYAPLAAVLVQEGVQAAFLGTPEERREFHHGHTYGGNPVASAAGLAVLRLMQEQGLVAHAAAMGDVLREQLEGMAERLPGIRAVRGAGLLQGFDLDPAVYGPAPGPAVERAARKHGLLARIGRNFIVFAPPLTINADEIEGMTERLEASIASVAAVATANAAGE
jgi:adenosylmethionine-8-amino-7-oxononanoate aminotransferase